MGRKAFRIREKGSGMKYITEALEIQEDFPLVVSIGSGFSREEEQSGRAVMHNHHSLEINYCLEGEGRYLIGDDQYPIFPGDVFIINNLEYHRAVNEDGRLKLLVIVFDADLVLLNSEDYSYIRAFYEWKPGFRHRLSGKSLVTEEIKALLEEMRREWVGQAVGYRMVLKSDLMKLLALVYRRFAQTEGYGEQILLFQTGRTRLAPALSLMEARFQEELTLAELAASVHMNPNYFSGLFSSLMGCTASEYLIRRRLKHAAMLLVTTAQSILSVALESGFHNVPYFNRTFRRHFGIPPGEYRRNGATMKQSDF